MRTAALLWTFLWRRGDRVDRAQLVFFGVAMAIIAIGFFVDFGLWVYLLIYAGLAVSVVRSYLAFRKSQRALEESLADFRRVREIEYFEWLHDASPDD